MSEQSKVVFQKGKRVILRPILRSDVPKLMQWINDPETNQYLLTYFPMMEKDEEEWVDKLSSRKPNNIVFGIETTEGVFIGTMGIHNIEWKDRIGTTGALIGELEYLGKGYGSEAKMLLLDYAFNTLNLRKICSSVLSFNERSYRYNLRCGYKEEGRLKKHRFKHGKYYDEILMTIFAEDFKKIWKRFKKTGSPKK